MLVITLFFFFLANLTLNCITVPIYNVVGIGGLIYLIKIPFFLLELHFIEKYNSLSFENVGILSQTISYVYLVYTRSPFSVLMTHLLSQVFLRSLFTPVE
jgi:hypothetical protein